MTAREYKRLARHWPEEAPGPEEPRPQTITGMIQADIRGELRRNFKEFLEHPEGMSGVYLLNKILLDYLSGQRELGDAVDYQLSRSTTYVKVPDEHATKVESSRR